jgi:CubicO group peptidase (beta-lactamase class C family)
MVRTASSLTGITVGLALWWSHSVAHALFAGLVVGITYLYAAWDSRWWWKSRKGGRFDPTSHEDWRSKLIKVVECKPGWEPVRDEFMRNFECRGELGAACCVYYRGEKVVDVYGGYREYGSQAPWERNTLVNVFSVTKGIVAFATALQQSKGKLDPSERVAKYWLEFAQNGKDAVTVEQLIGHKCGLAGCDPPVDYDVLCDTEKTNSFFAGQPMEWIPGEKKGYMCLTLGWYESALVQYSDPEKRTVGKYLKEEVVSKLGLDDEFYLGLPDSIPDSRLAVLDAPTKTEVTFSMGDSATPPGLVRKILFQPKSYTGKACNNPKLENDGTLSACYNERRVRRIEMPAANGHATARALARIYSSAEDAIRTHGQVNALGLTQETLRHIMEPCSPSYDETLLCETSFHAGFAKPSPEMSNFGCDSRAFGHAGNGGAFAFCDPTSGLSFAYTPNRTGLWIADDTREFALRVRAYECAEAARANDPVRAKSEAPLPLQLLRTPGKIAWNVMRKHPELHRGIC